MTRCVALKLCAIIFAFASFITNAQTITIPLSGTGEVPSSFGLSVNPALLENGEVELGLQRSQEFTITHTGGPEEPNIEILSVEIGGQDSYDFTSDYAGYNTLNTGQSFNFSVTFSPVTLGYKKAFLRIEHSGENSPHLVLMTGVGIDVPSSELKITDNSLEFGTVQVDIATNKTLTLTNAGGNGYPPINLFNVTIAGDNADSFNTNYGNTVTLDPGQSTKIVTTMTSTIAGQKAAQLIIDHDGSNPSIRVDLKGTVILPPEPDPEPIVDDPTTPVPPTPGGLTSPDFLQTKLKGATPQNPTSLQFGPNGNLYVAERDGDIWEYEVTRTNKNTYNITKSNKIGLVQAMKNHNDDGSVNNGVKGRLVTGILATGTAAKPEIFVASSDPRMAAGPSGNDSNLDTNSVIISKLTKNGANWSKKDLVRGLPRSEENHVGNGMQLSANGNILYIAMGGHTNMGIPSNNFASTPEYALSAAIVAINLNQIGNNTYDLPTLDDEDRPGANDNNDPFGGNDGKNMAILENNGPISIHAPGFRNAFDLLLTEEGRMYTVDNGPNAGWGDKPAANCLGTYKQAGGDTHGDSLHFIKNKGYYGGHPNPTRGSKNNTFNDSNPQSPIQGNANPVECGYKVPGKGNNALHVFGSSTNGLGQYTASNFSGSMKGDLLAASFNKSVYRIQLNNNGDKIIGLDKFFTNLGTPLDVTSQGDNDTFPGTVWISDYAQNTIHIFEPKDYQ